MRRGGEGKHGGARVTEMVHAAQWSDGDGGAERGVAMECARWDVHTTASVWFFGMRGD
jgi:hypothetical protein